MRLLPFVALTLALADSILGQTYLINTFAGGGLPVNIPAVSVSIDGSGLAVDAAGNVFFSNTIYNVVFRLDAKTGFLTVVAGSGIQGYSGDNGPATSADLNYPRGIAVDAAGSLFIADWNNQRVRKVSKGVITTVAGNGTEGFTGDGGLATNSGLLQPSAVTVDAAGTLYIADAGNRRIRKVANGVITTVAGGGKGCPLGGPCPAISESLSGPTEVAIDAAGNLYIGETAFGCVRKVSNGVLTTVVCVTNSITATTGVAVDAAGNLYIAEEDNHRIRKVANGVITTVAGNGIPGLSGDGGPAISAKLYFPRHVAVDSAGNLYIADASRIRKVSSGVITTAAGNTNAAPFIGDGGRASSGGLSQPRGVAVDTVGQVYIADMFNSRVRKVSRGVMTTVMGGGSGCPQQTNSLGDGCLATNALSQPAGVAHDGAGSLYIAEFYSHRIRRLANDMITTVAGSGMPGFGGDGGPATSAKLYYPSGIALDAAGNLYIADSGNHRIRKVANGVITTVAGTGNGTVGFSGDGGPATSAELSSPAGVAVDTSGSVYIADTYNNRIRKISNGVIVTVAGNGAYGYGGDGGPATNAILSSPFGVSADAAGSLYIADSGNRRIRKVSNGVITTVAGGGSGCPQQTNSLGDGCLGTSAQLGNTFAPPAGFPDPIGVTVDADGRVYVADQNNDRIRVLVPSNGATPTISSLIPRFALAAGAGFTLTVSGTGFVSGAIAKWNASTLVTTYVSAIQVTASVPANLTAAAGSATITIINPDGAASNAVTFTINPSAEAISFAATGIVNAASYVGGPIAPGEIVTIFGAGFGPNILAGLQLDQKGYVSASLGGTQVSFDGIAAPLLYAKAGQVSAVVPYLLGGKASTQIQIRYQEASSKPVNVPVAVSAPGIFTLDASGRGQAAIVNQDGTVNSVTNPASVGSVVLLYLTGEGQTLPGGMDGKPASAPLPKPVLPISVAIGGIAADVRYAGGAPGIVAGVMQMNVQIPSGVQAGNAVPVVVTIGNAQSQPGVTIAACGN